MESGIIRKMNPSNVLLYESNAKVIFFLLLVMFSLQVAVFWICRHFTWKMSEGLICVIFRPLIFKSEMWHTFHCHQLSGYLCIENKYKYRTGVPWTLFIHCYCHFMYVHYMSCIILSTCVVCTFSHKEVACAYFIPDCCPVRLWIIVDTALWKLLWRVDCILSL